MTNSILNCQPLMKNSILFPVLIIFFGLFISCSQSKDAEQNQENTEVSKSTKIADPMTPSANAPFSIKSGVVSFVEENVAGEKLRELTYSFDNFVMLVKLDEIDKDGELSVYMYNSDTKRGLKLFPGKTKAIKTYGIPGEIAPFIVMQTTSGFNEVDSDQIAGKLCKVFENKTVKDGNPLLTLWHYKGFTLKSLSYLTKSGRKLDATHFEEKAVDRSVFTMPKGTDMPYDIFEKD
jgi:hypothetical protein